MKLNAKLNAKTIGSLTLPQGKSEIDYWDDEITGFSVRIREGGSRKFSFRYRIGGTIRRISLGPAIADPKAVAKVRETAADYAHRVSRGEDPAMEKATARAEAEHTVGALIETHLETRKREMKPRSFEEVERHLTRHASSLHRFPITKVTQSDIAKLLNGIETERGPIAANRTRSSLLSFFGWVLSEGTRLPEGNPVAHTRTRDEQSRDRVLTDAELKRIWRACPPTEYGAIVKLLMLTGQRRDEVAGLRSSELVGSSITLPKERTKNGRAHVVPLSDPAKAILTTFPRNDEFVFGQNCGAGFSGFSHCKAVLDETINRDGKMARWTLHDLRRTAATRMADLGVQPHIIEAVLNHVSGHKGGIAGVYNRATYDREKREALNLWAEHVMATVEGRAATVVPLKRA
jgi:integrase